MDKLSTSMAGDMSEPETADVVVIGGGIFGCLTSIELATQGLGVILAEKNTDIMQGASLNNQNRLHLGYHYPRDVETAIQCQRGFDAFKARFADSILDGFDNAYFISSEASHVTFSDYIDFCNKASLKVVPVDLDRFKPEMNAVSGGLYTDEVVYDSAILRDLVAAELESAAVKFHNNAEIISIEQQNKAFILHSSRGAICARAVVNCTYANFNDFNACLGVESKKLQYELTVVPIVAWKEGCDPLGITVMDGRFFTILPFGKTGKYLLYHVDHTVQDTFIGFEYPAHWRNPKTAIGNDAARRAFQQMLASSSHWLADIRDAEYLDYLATVRVVLAGVERTDRRPSLIEKAQTENPFYTVFSGKIDHSIWVAKEIAEKLSAELKELCQQNPLNACR